MPYLVPVELRDSPLQGRGVFAGTNIPKGTVIWLYHCENPHPIDGFTIEQNQAFNREELEAMNDPLVLQKMLHLGIYYQGSNQFLLFRDGTQFTNHSSNPNSLTVYPESKDYREISVITLRDIAAGEELTESYSTYRSDLSNWLPQIMERYCPQSIQFERSIQSKRLEDK